MRQAILKALENAKKYIAAGDSAAVLMCIDFVIDTIAIDPDAVFPLPGGAVRNEVQDGSGGSGKSD